jgi:Zinc knuckle
MTSKFTSIFDPKKGKTPRLNPAVFTPEVPESPTTSRGPIDPPDNPFSPELEAAERIAAAVKREEKGKAPREDDDSEEEMERAKPPEPSGGHKDPEEPTRGPSEPLATEQKMTDPEREIRRPKAILPTPFTGERKDWAMFVMQVTLYIDQYQEYFASDEKKAFWILQQFEGEAPKAWATGVLTSYGSPHEHPGLHNWKQLLQEASELWGPVDLFQEAARKLRTIKQFHSVAEYHAEFAQYAFVSGYNQKALAEAFYFGLKDSIKDMMVHEERPDTLARMLGLALRFEARILARMGERRAEGTSRSRANAKATRLSQQQRNEYMKAGKCFECGQQGHRARNCPKKKGMTQAKKTNPIQEQIKKEEEPGKEEQNEEDLLED